MEIMTAKDALIRMKQRYEQKCERNPKARLVGLDVNDYLRAFLESTDVIVLEYTMQPGSNLESLMEEHKQEMMEQGSGAKSLVLQIICGKGFELMMEDMNSLAAFVDLLSENTNFYWGIDREETTEFQLKVEVYVVK